MGKGLQLVSVVELALFSILHIYSRKFNYVKFKQFHMTQVQNVEFQTNASCKLQIQSLKTFFIDVLKRIST
jgi:hypothetical protein